MSRLDHPDAYVRKIIVNRYVSDRRRKSSTEVVTTDLPERSSDDVTEAIGSRDEVRQLLAGLAPKQRAVLVLRYYADLDAAAIADLLGCGAPVSGVLCSYSGQRLVMGVTLGAKDLATITADLDRLPASYTAAELAAQRAPYAIEGSGLASILLTDAGGRTQQITAQGSSRGVTPGVAGATQSTLTQALSGDLSAARPSGFGANAFHTGPAAELPSG